MLFLFLSHRGRMLYWLSSFLFSYGRRLLYLVYRLYSRIFLMGGSLLGFFYWRLLYTIQPCFFSHAKPEPKACYVVELDFLDPYIATTPTRPYWVKLSCQQ